MENNTPKRPGMVRFQIFLTHEQHQFLRKLTYEKNISGGSAVRQGLRLFARKHGADLPAESTAQ